MPTEKSGKEGSKKILVIDDEPSIGRLIQDFLTSRGFSVLTAQEGARGIEILERERPDLVFLDVLMPKMNGLEVLKRIKMKLPSCAVIMLSAVQEEETAREAIRLGAYDYLTKPVDLVRLENEFVRRILG